MPITFSDQEIQSLIEEPKTLPGDWLHLTTLRPKRGHEENQLDLTGEHGNRFYLILRKNSLNHLDFSVIIATLVPNSNKRFRLRRYNGKSHEHANKIEREKFYDFHIHYATERYQELRHGREDSYAKPTTRYSDYQGAISCLIDDCNVKLHDMDQRTLFPGA